VSEQGQEIRAPIEERLDRFFAELRRQLSLGGGGPTSKPRVRVAVENASHGAIPSDA
jgi:hypothetical protein